LVRWLGVAGDVTGAVAAAEGLLADHLRVLGPGSPYTLTTRGSLAALLGATGDVAAAVAAVEGLLADCLRVLGPDHPYTLTVRASLADLLGQADPE
jgi:Tetratricopeptide repeat